MSEFVLFAFLHFTANKTNSFVCFLGKSTARPNCFWFYMTFSSTNRFKYILPYSPISRSGYFSIVIFSLVKESWSIGKLDSNIVTSISYSTPVPPSSSANDSMLVHIPRFHSRFDFQVGHSSRIFCS